jgi:IrrE N-terminal-like domain
LCRRLRKQSGQRQPPFDVGKYAAARGVTRIVEQSGLPSHGVVQREGAGLSIKVNADLPRVRKRFVCCHELVHTFFEEAAGRYRLHALGRNAYTREEERLCDAGAAELLVPGRMLKRMLAGRPVDADLLGDVGRTFEVSLLVASRRVAECSDEPIAVVHWASVAGVGRSHLRPVYFSKAVPRLFLRAPEQVEVCVSGARRTVFEVPWPGSDKRRIVCETIALPGGAAGRDADGRFVALSLLHAVP